MNIEEIKKLIQEAWNDGTDTDTFGDFLARAADNIEKARYVKLADDQGLPANSSSYWKNFEETYGRRPKDIVFLMGQQFKEQDMLKEGFRRVIQ